jgi:hypothetical protein
MSTYTRFSSADALTFWRGHLPYSDSLVGGYATLYKSFGTGLSSSNFVFTNVVDATNCIGNIHFVDLPLGRFHAKFQIFRSDATSFGTSLSYNATNETNVYFNRDYSVDYDFLLDESAYALDAEAIGPRTMNSVVSNERTITIEIYFTTTDLTNDFDLTITNAGSFPGLAQNSQNGLFTCVCVGPSSPAVDGYHNFVDDLNYIPA